MDRKCQFVRFHEQKRADFLGGPVFVTGKLHDIMDIVGKLPVMQEVRREAERQKIKLLTLPTIGAIELLDEEPKDTNAILHVTC